MSGKEGDPRIVGLRRLQGCGIFSEDIKRNVGEERLFRRSRRK